MTDQPGRSPLEMFAHELRRPLSLIAGNAELLEYRAGQLSRDQIAELVTEIRTGARSMERLIHDLERWSPAQKCLSGLRRRWVDVGEELRHWVRAFQIRPGGDRLRLELEGDLRGYADAERLYQVVSNLIANALRYAPDGPVIVRARSDQGQLLVEVIDQGPGLGPDEQTRVWRSGYRGKAARGDDGGRGLGLAVVQELVEAQHGQVGVRSRPGQETVFWFRLPLSTPSEERLPPRRDEVAALAHSARPAAPPEGVDAQDAVRLEDDERSVLVVEDDRWTREVVAMALNADGFQVVEAADGFAALRAIEQRSPAVVLLDLMLPGMDGVQFAEELDRRGLRARVPIIVMSAADQAQVQAAHIGADAYVPKPFDVARLLETVARVAA